jgi:cytochrome c biogenesis protein CcmG/thiol:disulfide interchange protein DsbE
MIGRLLPVLVFALLGVLLAVGLKIADRKSELPSPLVGKPMPSFSLPLLGQDGVVVNSDDLIGEPFLVNFWASWCVTCRVEHPVIEQLARSGAIRIIGLNFRDEPEDALAWLDRFGNPYAMNIQDYSGRTSIDFGVYAAPESFLIDETGTIVFKQLGALTPEVIEKEILPRVARQAGVSD